MQEDLSMMVISSRESGTASWQGSSSQGGSAAISCLWVAWWTQPPLAYTLQSP